MMNEHHSNPMSPKCKEPTQDNLPIVSVVFPYPREEAAQVVEKEHLHPGFEEDPSENLLRHRIGKVERLAFRWKRAS